MYFMKQYINLNSLTYEFLFRVLIIVLFSWGVIYFTDYLGDLIFPDVNKMVRKMVENDILERWKRQRGR